MSDSFPPDGDSVVKPASRWEDFIDIFYAPSSVFARRATSGFGIPMLVVTVLLGAIFIANSGAMQPIMDAEFARATAAQMKNGSQITPEQMAAGKSFMEKGLKVGIFFLTPLVIFLVGLFLWLVGKFVDAKQSLGAAIMVSSYAFVPRIVESVVNGVQMLLLDPANVNGRFRISLGVGRFFDPDVASPMLMAWVGRIDVFTIWVTVLLAIGLSVTGKVSREKAIIAGVVMWLVGAMYPVLGALRG
jgi:hypothetical protein